MLSCNARTPARSSVCFKENELMNVLSHQCAGKREKGFAGEASHLRRAGCEHDPVRRTKMSHLVSGVEFQVLLFAEVFSIVSSTHSHKTMKAF